MTIIVTDSSQRYLLFRMLDVICWGAGAGAGADDAMDKIPSNRSLHATVFLIENLKRRFIY